MRVSGKQIAPFSSAKITTATAPPKSNAHWNTHPSPRAEKHRRRTLARSPCEGNAALARSRAPTVCIEPPPLWDDEGPRRRLALTQSRSFPKMSQDVPWKHRTLSLRGIRLSWLLCEWGTVTCVPGSHSWRTWSGGRSTPGCHLADNKETRGESETIPGFPLDGLRFLARPHIFHFALPTHPRSRE